MSARKFQKFHFVVLRVCVQANYRVNAKLFADASWWRIVIFFRIASKQTRLASYLSLVGIRQESV